MSLFAIRTRCPPTVGLYAKWSPADLPPLEPAAAPGQKRRSYAQAVTEVILGFVFLAWLLLVPKFPFLMFGPGAAILHASPFRLNPQLLTFYWWIVGLNALQLVWRCIDLVRGAWQHPGPLPHLVTKLFGVIPLLFVAYLPGAAYVLLRHPETDMSRYAETADSINRGVHIGLQVLCAIVILQLAWDIAQALMKVLRGPQEPR